MTTQHHQNSLPDPDRTNISNSEVALRRILREAPQSLWLDTIRRTRSDAHNGLIYWMLSQPECDFAVAAHAFYLTNPVFHIENPKPLTLRPGPSHIFALVLINWDTGFFRTHNLKVEPIDVHPRVLSRLNQKILVHQYGSLPFQIPDKFLHPEGGSPAQVPPHLSPDDSPRLWPIYAELGLSVPDTAPGIKRRIERVKEVLKKIGIGKA